jgi:MFS family permease
MIGSESTHPFLEVPVLLPTAIVWAAAQTTTTLTLDPNGKGLPGASVLNLLTNGLGWWALTAAMVGIVVGAVIWAFGHYSQNYQQAYNGRRGVMVSAAAGLLIGGAPHIINWFLDKSSLIR